MTAMLESMERVALLTRALRDPFVILNDVSDETSGAGRMPIWDWVRFLRTTFPLSCLRPSAFARLNHGDLPTTHPLRAIVRSIIEDEGVAEAPGLLSIQGVEGLALI